ncbi:MAG: isoaspartyl peptidase/L-asparaginase [Planctomycetota bacterium]
MSKSLLHPVTVFVGLLLLAPTCPVSAQQKGTWAIALHGGAGAIPRDLPNERIAEYRVALADALQAGTEVLRTGGTSLDAVQATVMKLEDNPLFNAGRGAVFDAGGRHQMDASIMDGNGLRGGGISMVTRLKNPITAARLVMDKTGHVLLAGAEAEAFALEQGCESVDPSYFYTDRRWNQLLKKLQSTGRELPKSPAYGFPPGAKANTVKASPPTEIGDTVGCVALDRDGHLAAATSTGGLTGKMLGRIGDSPILGTGSYADDNSVAVSGTGKGEEFIRHSIASRVGWLVADKGYTLENAGKHCLENVLSAGQGGLIAVDRNGNVFLDTNTGAMPRAWATSDGSGGVAIWEKPLATE